LNLVSVLATVLVDVFVGTLFLYFWKAKYDLFPGYLYLAVSIFSYGAAVATAIVPQYENAIHILVSVPILILLAGITLAERKSKNFVPYAAAFIVGITIFAVSLLAFAVN
jgi:uncharacterized membrane protein YoaK (UPF0700 family)